MWLSCRLGQKFIYCRWCRFQHRIIWLDLESAKMWCEKKKCSFMIMVRETK